MKEVKWYKQKYLQGSLSDSECGQILNLIEDVSSIDSLKHCIQDLPPHEVQDIINDYENYEKEHGNMDGFHKGYATNVGELRDMQTVGVAFMYIAKSALLGDEVGLGKTVQCAGLVNLIADLHKKQGKPFRYCFLTEKSSINQIRNKMIQFTGQYTRMLESGEQGVVKKYIKSYENGNHCSVVGGHSLLNSSEFLIHTSHHPFDLIIIDESSIIKNTSSDVFKNTQAILKYHDRKILLNATPLEQNALEFYNQLNLLDSTFLPTLSEFKKRYCVMKQGAFGFTEIDGYKNTDEFKQAVGLRYLARTRAGSGAQYVDNSYKTILVPLSDVQKRLIKKTTLYSMVHDFPPGVDRTVEFNIETTPKAGALLYVLSQIDVASGKALVYCRFVDCQAKLKELLEDAGYRTAILNGTTKVKEKNEIISKFLSNGYDVLITNIQRGLDLNNCDNCIMYTIDPNPQKMVQFEGRMTRDFNVMYKSLYLLVCMGKEKKFVEETLKLRVDASDAFVTTGKSMTLAALKKRDNIEMFTGSGTVKEQNTNGATIGDIRTFDSSKLNSDTNN